MAHTLKNKNIAIVIDTPSENYNGSRFDWTGKIVTVEFQNIPLTTVEDKTEEDNYLLGKGLYNEFGIDSPVGFEETEIGGWFHKIGIGLLKKEEDLYLFHKKHPIKPAKFKVFSNTNHIVISCKSELVNGYSYILRKEIKLHASSFSVHYSLKNTGIKTINTNEYSHNFMAINNTLNGKEYSLEFPFELKQTLFEETVNNEQKVNIGINRITFNGSPKEQFFFSNLTGSKTKNIGWTLLNSNTNIGIQESTDFKTDKVNLWGSSHVISPELFYKISINPGELSEWSRFYEVFKINS